MKPNRRKENKANRFRLEINGVNRHVGYDRPDDLLSWAKVKGVHYRLFENDQLVDEA